MIYVTPYDLKTKKALCPSAPGGGETLDAVRATMPQAEELTRSRRLICLDVMGQGVAVSDYRIA